MTQGEYFTIFLNKSVIEKRTRKAMVFYDEDEKVFAAKHAPSMHSQLKGVKGGYSKFRLHSTFYRTCTKLIAVSGGGNSGGNNGGDPDVISHQVNIRHPQSEFFHVANRNDSLPFNFV